MIMRLLKNGSPVLTARSKHTKDNAGSDLPISYEGNTSYIPDDMECVSVDILEGILSLVARKNNLQMDGDYLPMIMKGEIVLPPPEHPWWQRHEQMREGRAGEE